MFVRASVVALALLFIHGCSCGDPDVRIEQDGGDLVVECLVTEDCAFGQSCIAGRCGVGDEDGGFDAGFECQEHTDCPATFVCLKSENRCVPKQSGGDAGELDAGSGCFDGDARACGPSKLGECRLGVETCSAGSWSQCIGSVLPTSEACDSKDNDCNGLIDDPYDKATDVNNCGFCGRACSFPFATPLCSGGNCQMGPCDQGHVDLNLDPVDGCEYACALTNGGTEICDNKDNDCDGLTDEGQTTLACGVGACAKTVSSCVNGVPQICTPNAGVAEVCDGADNDCDGQSDNGLSNLTCGQGECFRSVPACSGTSPNNCVAGTPNTTELCDGKDDNCNGQVDENCACINGNVQSCYSGSPGTAGNGVCRSGMQTCSGGQWGSCAGEVKDSAEVCDGADNDCDLSTDEGLPNLNCGTGACARTVSTCVGGAPNSTCTPGTPGTEVCDNADNDCNGQTDEGTVTCGVGACTVTISKCTGGAANTCFPGAPTTEICDGVDNNCQGQIDESYPQMGQSCATGLQGLCATGTRSCAAGVLGCQQTVQPSNEVCNNGLDENCNGTVDDPLACGCDAAIDRDLDGANQCVDCNDTDGTIKPGATERCNGRDDDCDGAIDEGFDVDGDGFSACGTVSGGGTDPTRIDCNDANAFVFPGKVADCGSAATLTTPNSVDDNCNGYVDETCSCSNTDSDGDGLSQCQGDCAPNDPAIRPGRTEICDGKDNDCDRDTIDNCGVSEPCGYRSGSTYVPWAAGTDQCKPDLLCTRNASTNELTCGSLCNQTVGTGLGDSCAAGEGCLKTLLDSDALHICSVTTVGAKTTGQTCAGETAAGNAECRSGDCIVSGANAYCTDQCSHEAGCSANTTCVPTKYVSTSQGPNPTGWFYGSSCRLDSTITGTRTLGQSCTGSECRTGVEGCFNGKCTEPCCANSECGAGYGCSLKGPRVYTGYALSSTGEQIFSAYPACLAITNGKTQGQSCAASTECASGICEKTQNVCIDVCCNDTSCTNGTSCEFLDFRFSDGKRSSIRVCAKAPLPAIVEQK